MIIKKEDFYPSWIKNNKIIFDENLNKIIEFYLFQTPLNYDIVNIS